MPDSRAKEARLSGVIPLFHDLGIKQKIGQRDDLNRESVLRKVHPGFPGNSTATMFSNKLLDFS